VASVIGIKNIVWHTYKPAGHFPERMQAQPMTVGNSLSWRLYGL